MKKSVYGGFLLLVFCLSASSAINTWQGKTNDWYSQENWSTGKIPAPGDGNDVLVPEGMMNYPILSRNTVIGGTLIVEKNATITLAGHNLQIANLQHSAKKGISIQGTLDASQGNPVITAGPGGFTNAGKIIGTPSLVLAGQCYDAEIKPGGANFSSLILPAGSYSYRVTLKGSAIITGNLILKGHGLYVPKGVTLTVQGDIIFAGEKEKSAAIIIEGNVLLSGNIISDNSAVCGGGGEKNDAWLTLVKGPHQIEVNGDQAVLPPLLVPEGSNVKLKTSIACAGLKIENNGILDASTIEKITFGGAGSISSYTRGLINEGTIIGQPALVFSSGCYNARLKAGTAVFRGLTLDTGNYGYSLTAESDLKIEGDITFKVGGFNLGENTLILGGSCYLPLFPEKAGAVSFRLNFGKNARIVFQGSSPAVLDSGGVRAEYYYSSIFPSLTVDKPGSVLTIRKAPLEVNGTFKLAQGKVETAEGGELWLGVVRDTRYAHYEIHDVGLKLQGPLGTELFPEIIPAPVPETVPGVVTIVHNQVGSELPQGLELVNIAPMARISSVPYTTMLRLLVDPDEKLRTLPVPEKGTPVKVARYCFKFDAPQEIVAVKWAVPSGPWAILADTTGNGDYSRLLRADLEGKITNPGGIWKSRTWIINTFQPSVKGVYGILLVTFGTPHYYDVQILSPRKSVNLKPVASPDRS
ncbi:MAG TPA: hypothetical protein PLP13_03500, partial [bacterium]|nr:hypothetical protein [bacterium]